jgi:microtubule-associated protein-like 6
MDRRRIVAMRHLKQKVRSVAFSPDGNQIAAGLVNGGLLVVHSSSLLRIVERKDRAEAIQQLKYSPNGEYLAVGSRDNYIDIYKVSTEYHGWKRIGVCSGHSSYITHIDFSCDSSMLQSNDGAYDHLVWSVPNGHRATSEGALLKTEWWSWTCTKGWPVVGIFPPYADGTDVNAADRTNSQTIVATGDDFGKVKIFRYPCTVEGAGFKEYKGHSSHVTNVMFSCDDRSLCSVGGMDLTLMQWQLLEEPEE